MSMTKLKARRAATAIIAVSMAYIFTVPAMATDYTWNSSAGGLFTSSSNWTPAGGPGGAADTVNFELGISPSSRYNVMEVVGANDWLLVHNDSLALEVFNSAAAVDYETVNATVGQPNFVVGITGASDVILESSPGGGIATFQSIFGRVDAGSLLTVRNIQWNNSDLVEVVDGTLTIESGADLNGGSAVIGVGDSDSGHALVTGPDSSWTTSGLVIVGLDGSGELISRNSATVTSGGLLLVGFNGEGSLTVDGGAFFSSATTHVGRNMNSVGTVSVNGGTWVTNGLLELGQVGSGTMRADAGSFVVSFSAVLGEFVGSLGEATISGSNTLWTNDGSMEVGREGTGTLSVEDRAFVQSTSTLAVGNGSTGHGAVHVSTGGVLAAAGVFIANANGSVGTVEVSGANSVLAASADVHVGRFGSGSLTISDGAEVTNANGWVGTNPTATGNVIVHVAGSAWNNSGQLRVGGAGQGNVTIQNGGVLSSASARVGFQSPSTSMVTVNGAGSAWNNSGPLDVGDRGIVQVSDGGALSSGITHISGVESSVIIDGGSFTLVTPHTLDFDLNVADGGTLQISNGGTVSSQYGFILGADSSIIVDGIGTSWAMSAQLEIISHVDDTIPGTLTIQNGGKVTSVDGFVAGTFPNTQGRVIIDGAGSTWTNSSFFFIGNGNNSHGRIDIQNGGTLSTKGASIEHEDTMVSVGGTDSRWINDGDIGVANRAVIDVNDGGILSVSGTLFIDSNARLTGDGTIEGDVNNSAWVAPGNSPGTLHVDGNYTQGTSGALDIEIASAASFDYLDVTGAAALDGTLRVSLLDSFVPAAGHSFELLTAAGGIIGQFSNAELPPLPEGKSWQLDYGMNSVILTAVPEPSMLVLLAGFLLAAACFHDRRWHSAMWAARKSTARPCNQFRAKRSS